MPEPITPQAGQPGDGIQGAGQEPVLPQAIPPASTPPEPGDQPTAEQIAQWRTQADQAAQYQQQLAAREQQLQQVTESAKYFQGQTHRLQQALGAPQQQPAADPLTPYIQKLVAKGYGEKEARDVAGLNYEMVQQQVAPLQQELAATRNALAVEPQIKGSLDALYGQSPHLFATPGVYDRTMNDVRTAVQQGMRIDDKFVEQMAVLAAHEMSKGKPPQAAPVQPPPQIFQNGMTRPATGYPYAQPLTNQPSMTQDQATADAFIKDQFKISKA